MLPAIALAVTLPLAGANDIPNSEDPSLVERYPRSWIVQFLEVSDVEPYRFVSAPVEKIKREVSYEGAHRLQATWKEVTYEIPSGVERAEIAEHYLAEIARTGGQVVFSCDGSDCGRGTTWANDVLKQPKLASPDRNQHYIAASWQGSEPDRSQILAALYIVERGNGKVFAHVEEIHSTEVAEFDPNAHLAAELAKHGFVSILDLTPRSDGSFGQNELAAVRKLAPKLAQFSGQSLYVVCHVFAVQSVELLIESSKRCAIAVADEISQIVDFQLVPFGMGPLAPGSGSGSRVELVLPARISRSLQTK